jgi:membrane-bound lytic murein transglycosylase D
MDLRAFIHKIVFVFLFTFGGRENVFAFPHKNDNPLVPYEVKFADITFQLNDVTRYLIQMELKNIQLNRQSIQNQLDKIALFLPVVEPILKEQNVPDDFKYLVSYNKYQSSIETSTSLESGVYWCLDKEKAADVDLLMNNQLDERKHLIAATKGASMCLKRNNVLYKNWGTTLFSHISDKKVLHLLDVSRKWSDNVYILLDSPAYSAILQFLAYKIAIEREFPVYKPSVQNIVYEYPYSKGKTLDRISAELKVEPATLAEYNLWLTAKNVPDTECQVLVVVPASRYNEVRILAELSRKSGLPAKDLGFPVLKREETITKKSKGINKGGIFFNINDLKGVQAEMCDVAVTMAYKSDISIEKFVEYNDMKVTDLLHIGQVYYIEKKIAKASVPFHVVREGETLWDISQMYGVRLANLLDYNRLESVQRLQRGRIVWLQTIRPKNKPIEYIEMPDEFAVIEDILSTEKEDSFVLVQVKESVEIVGNQANDVKNNSNIPKEIERDAARINSLPSSQEINIEQEKNTVKNDVPKEIDINSLPLSQEIRKEQAKNLNLPKGIDSKDVALNIEEKSKVVLKGEKVKKEDKNPYSEQVTSREVNKSESQFVYHTVRKDETLFRISVNYNVSVENLWKMNSLSSTIVEAGTVLKVKRL